MSKKTKAKPIIRRGQRGPYTRRKVGPNAPGAGPPFLAVPSVALNTCLPGAAGAALERLRGDTRPGVYLGQLLLAEAKRKGLK